MGMIKRTSRIYLINLNKGKTLILKQFLLLYASIVRYYIEMFWSVKNFTGKYSDKVITDRAVARFGITARLSQAAAKQAKEIVKSQRKKSKRKQTMPEFRNITVNLDNRFFSISKFKGSFDWAIKFTSGLPKIVVPFNNTRHTLKFINSGWILSNSIRLGIKNNRLFIDLIFKKEKPAIKTKGDVIGIDIGYRVLLATSRGELIGRELKEKIEQAGKRNKKFHKYIATEVDRLIKKIDLTEVKTICVENLKKVKHNKRGKFSRRVNRLLSFWLYARVIQRLRQICELYGVLLLVKSPYKTSQRCPLCGKIDRRNRNADKFKCTNCGFEQHADIVGALNLRALGLAGAYSLRSLQS